VLFTDLPLSLVRGLALVFGLLWGSFLNVVIYRVPRGMSVVRPPSHCPACGANVKPWLNVPVLSYVILRGRAGCCGAKMSPRYPLVELLGGGLSLAIVEVVLRDLPGKTSVGEAALIYVAYLALCLGLLAAAFIDLEHMLLPDTVTIGGTILGVATAGLRGMPYQASVLGAVVGALTVWLPFIVLYRLVRGREGMGLGDAKLLALAGAWFGWLGAVVVLFAGAIQGSVAAIAVLATRGKIEEPEAVRADREELAKAAAEGDEEAKAILAGDPLGAEPEEGFGKARVPFGPFLILAIYEFMFFGDRIVAFMGF
jgi:leader peptidase (prepilin peptidase)/N-methyltransferase